MTGVLSMWQEPGSGLRWALLNIISVDRVGQGQLTALQLPPSNFQDYLLNHYCEVFNATCVVTGCGVTDKCRVEEWCEDTGLKRYWAKKGKKDGWLNIPSATVDQIFLHQLLEEQTFKVSPLPWFKYLLMNRSWWKTFEGQQRSVQLQLEEHEPGAG